VLLGQVGGRSAITHETAVGGKDGLAIDADTPQPPGRVATAVLELSERLMPLQSRHVLAPFLRLGVPVERRIETALADQFGPAQSEGIQFVRDIGEHVVRPGLPEPVGRSLGEIAKSLFALAGAIFRLLQDQQVLSEFGVDLAQVTIGALQRGADAIERFDHLVEFIGFARRPAVQLERRRRPRCQTSWPLGSPE
jgi:hypothetical protein